MRNPGGAGGAGVYQTIINHIPPHDTFIATHLGLGALRSPSYFAASCGGAPISVVRQYIEQQATPD